MSPNRRLVSGWFRSNGHKMLRLPSGVAIPYEQTIFAKQARDRAERLAQEARVSSRRTRLARESFGAA